MRLIAHFKAPGSRCSACAVAVVLVLTVAGAIGSEGQRYIGNTAPVVHAVQQQQQQQQNIISRYNVQQPSSANYQQKPRGQLLLVGRAGGAPIRLLPGLLDETLLTNGSFSFGAKTVAFDKLKVLGNVYVNRVNGHVLRDFYRFKSSQVNKRKMDAALETGVVAGADKKEISVPKSATPMQEQKAEINLPKAQ